MAAIKRYTGQGYMYGIKGSRKTIDDLINKAPPTKKENVVYRGLRRTPTMDKNGLHINDSLVSTTTSLSLAKKFAGENGHVIKITIPSNSRVLNLLEYGEKEILLKAQSRLRYDKEPSIDNGYKVWNATLEFDGAKK